MKRVGWSNRKIKHQLKPVDIRKNPDTEVSHVITKIKAREREIMIVGVFLVLLVLISASWVVFTSVQKRDVESTIKDGNLMIHYRKTDTGVGDVVTLTENSTREEISFSITNTSKKKVFYQILLEDDLEMIEVDGCSDLFIDKESIYYQMNDQVISTLNNHYKNKKYVLYDGSIGALGKEKIKLSFWTSDSIKNENGHYHGKIVVKTNKNTD